MAKEPLYRGKRAMGRAKGQSRTRESSLGSAQVGAQILLACYLVAIVFSLTGLYVAFIWIRNDLSGVTGANQGSGMFLGISLIVASLLWIALLIALSRRLYAAINSNSTLAIRHFATFSILWEFLGALILALRYGPDVFTLFIPGFAGVFLILAALASASALATNRPTRG